MRWIAAGAPRWRDDSGWPVFRLGHRASTVWRVRSRPFPWLLAGAGLLMALAAGWILAAGAAVPIGEPEIAIDVALGLGYIATGVVVSRIRTRGLLWMLLVLVGLVWLLQLVKVAEHPVPAAIGWSASALPLAAIVALVLAFPGGRLVGNAERALVGAAVIVATVGQLAWLAVLPRLPGWRVSAVRSSPAGSSPTRRPCGPCSLAHDRSGSQIAVSASSRFRWWVSSAGGTRVCGASSWCTVRSVRRRSRW